MEEIFIVRTGNEKECFAVPFKNYLQLVQCHKDPQDESFTVFLDKDMKASNGNPRKQMECALETCRYALIIISKAFLKNKHPCEELKYAFRRNEWLKSRWHTLYIVLVDLTVEEYKAYRVKNKTRELPEIDKKCVLIRCCGNRQDTFARVKSEMIESDKKGSREAWKRFLMERLRNGPYYEGFPSASGIYDVGDKGEIGRWALQSRARDGRQKAWKQYLFRQILIGPRYAPLHAG